MEISNEKKKNKEMESHNNSIGESSKTDTYSVPIPYPERLLPLAKNNNHNQILEIFRQVKVNIPLLDAIKKVTVYAKFLKDLCTIKKQIHVHKRPS